MASKKEVADLWDELQAVIATDDAQRKRRRALEGRIWDNPGPKPATAKYASGFADQTDMLGEIERYVLRAERGDVP